MPIKARVNTYGDHTFTETLPWRTEHYTLSTGRLQVGSGTKIHEKHVCGRGGHTSNPKTIVNGVENYRQPAAYWRHVWDMTPMDSAHSYTRNGIRTTQTGYPNAFTMNHGWTMTPSSVGMANRGIVYSSPYVQDALNQSQIEALGRLGDRKANLALAIVEARKSVNLIASTAIRLASAYRSVRHGNFKLAAKHLGVKDTKGGAGNILQFNYGWMPLVMDANGLAQLVLMGLTRPLVVSARRTIKTSKETKPFYSAEGFVRQHLRTTCGVSGRLDDTYERIAAQASFPDPLTLGWELLPYSFVVDWLLPVGDYLEALQATAGLSFLSAWQSTSVETEFQVKSVLPSDASGTAPGFRGNGYTFDRKVFSTWPKPSPLYVKSPFKTRNAINAVALIRNLFR